MRYRNLVLIGTSHIASQSVKAVEQTILKEQPAIVALELDRKRLFALLHPQQSKMSLKDIKRVGFKGWLFSIIGSWVEHKLGEKVGVKPGSEMLQAYYAARKINAHLALIDQDIEVTLKRFSKSLTWKEKWRLLVDVFKGLVLRKQEFTFDLSKVPNQKVIEQMIRKVKKRYPSMYHVLVTERNHVMAHRLAYLMQTYPDKTIVAVIGAGHEKEILGLIKRVDS